MTSQTPSPSPSPRFALALAAVGLSTSALALAACASPAQSATSPAGLASSDAETVEKLDGTLDAAASENGSRGNSTPG